jgi:hypothetical protein
MTLNYVMMLIEIKRSVCLVIGKTIVDFYRVMLINCSSSPISSSRLHDNISSSSSSSSTNSHLLPVQQLHSSQRRRKDDRDLDADEENWFNDDTDDTKVSTLNHGTLFNGGSDDEDSQPEITGHSNAISTSEPSRSQHHHLLDNDDDGLPIGSTESMYKSFINE